MDAVNVRIPSVRNNPYLGGKMKRKPPPEDGCWMLIAGSYCGKPEYAEVHQTEAGHIFQPVEETDDW